MSREKALRFRQYVNLSGKLFDNGFSFSFRITLIIIHDWKNHNLQVQKHWKEWKQPVFNLFLCWLSYSVPPVTFSSTFRPCWWLVFTVGFSTLSPSWSATCLSTASSSCIPLYSWLRRQSWGMRSRPRWRNWPGRWCLGCGWLQRRCSGSASECTFLFRILNGAAATPKLVDNACNFKLPNQSINFLKLSVFSGTVFTVQRNFNRVTAVLQLPTQPSITTTASSTTRLWPTEYPLSRLMPNSRSKRSPTAIPQWSTPALQALPVKQYMSGSRMDGPRLKPPSYVDWHSILKKGDHSPLKSKL